MASQVFSTSKETRFSPQIHDTIVSPRVYNLTIGAVVVYGLVINYIICKYFSDTFIQMNPLILIIGYFVSAIAGTLIVARSHSPFVSFLGYNLVVVPLGAMLSTCLYAYDPAIIFQACGLTASVTVIMMCLGALFPQVFARMGRGLFISLIILIIVGIVSMFLPGLYSLYSYAGAAIFSLYIAYDWVRANQYVKTLDNAVDSACDIYVDIINLFLHILAILGRSDD